MFWVAMVLLEIDEPKLFSLVINLLEAVLRRLDQNPLHGNLQGGLENALAKADAVTGISFKTSFSFAVTAQGTK